MALKDITLGQYFPGNTILHRLDPRTKLLCTIAYIVALFLAKHLVSYLLLMAVLAGLILVSKVGAKAVFRGMRPILFIIVFTAVLNLFYTPGQGEPLASFWVFNIYTEGIWAAVFMILRIAMLITCTFLLTYTTSPILLTDGLETLMGPLKVLHVPVHELAMMMSIALRFIPTLIEETHAEGQGPHSPAGPPVHLRLPPGRRAGGGHGVPVLPRRRGAHPNAGAQAPGGRYRRPDRRGGSLRAHCGPGPVWAVTTGILRKIKCELKDL